MVGRRASTMPLRGMNGPATDYLTEPARMKRFYSAMKGRRTQPGPARRFRSNARYDVADHGLQNDADGSRTYQAVWKSGKISSSTILKRNMMAS